MSNRLPEIINPLHLADTRGELKGQLPVKTLTRLTNLLFNDTGAVDVNLFFAREGRLAKIEGQITTTLQLCCQSCLQLLEWQVNHSVKLGIVTSIEQANRLPEDYEPLLLNEETIVLEQMVEDELLLGLPDYPKHQHTCFQAMPMFEEPVVEEKPNPFSVLVNLKNLEI